MNTDYTDLISSLEDVQYNANDFRFDAADALTKIIQRAEIAESRLSILRAQLDLKVKENIDLQGLIERAKAERDALFDALRNFQQGICTEQQLIAVYFDAARSIDP